MNQIIKKAGNYFLKTVHRDSIVLESGEGIYRSDCEKLLNFMLKSSRIKKNKERWK
jgi:hypothetical protein